ncbi:hypothetical protein H8B09_14770 [Paenibacillus sp. PR3]|uniref:Uncharacterized protein n=1 Tax=Paenibacillus terricola TaxID=2763503 RepID=A0ABR8MYL2_9BACL|nr:hypothetical protein [Paenibacillus terricola]MBD3920025.1 hypothetical protein [Paenibacillus terricola]
MVMDRVGRVKRIVISITLCVLLIPILLNFVPIKFAIKLEDAQQKLKVGNYICVTESKYVLDTGWIAKTNTNTHLEENIAVKVSLNSPNKYLDDKEFDFKWFEIENKFLLVGEVGRLEKNKETNVLYVDLNVKKWEILYPVSRASFRKYFTPKGYLSIYDYDLKKILKTVW